MFLGSFIHELVGIQQTKKVKWHKPRKQFIRRSIWSIPQKLGLLKKEVYSHKRIKLTLFEQLILQ